MKALLSARLLPALLVLLGSVASAQVPARHYGLGVRASTYGAQPTYSKGRTWIPARYETVSQRVWVPSSHQRVWVDPCYEWRVDSCGRAYRILVRAGYWRTEIRPGHYGLRPLQVWRPGHWTVCSTR